MSQTTTIGWAVKQLWDGREVRRAGWNGKNMALFLVNDEVHRGKTGVCQALPYVMMRTVTGAVVPWLCSQTDLLAIDWEFAE